MKNFGKHHTFIGDNLVSLCCFEKGRARSWSLNVLCRRIAAYSMACQFRLHYRHLESKRNLADAGSRGHLLSSVVAKREQQQQKIFVLSLYDHLPLPSSADLPQRSARCLVLSDIVPPPGLGDYMAVQSDVKDIKNENHASSPQGSPPFGRTSEN
eukprot:11614883-Karenia_brevis.AAC.1